MEGRLDTVPFEILRAIRDYDWEMTVPGYCLDHVEWLVMVGLALQQAKQGRMILVTERGLAADLGLNRKAVSRAFSSLDSKGWAIEVLVGRGYGRLLQIPEQVHLAPAPAKTPDRISTSVLWRVLDEGGVRCVQTRGKCVALAILLRDLKGGKRIGGGPGFDARCVMSPAGVGQACSMNSKTAGRAIADLFALGWLRAGSEENTVYLHLSDRDDWVGPEGVIVGEPVPGFRVIKGGKLTPTE